MLIHYVKLVHPGIAFFMDINSLRENQLLQAPQKLVHFQHLTKSVIGRHEAICKFFICCEIASFLPMTFRGWFQTPSKDFVTF